MRLLFLDCETQDPLLKKYGSGWCFKYHYPEAEFEPLLFGYIDADGNEDCVDMSQDGARDKIMAVLESHDAIVGQNISYDLGVLKYFLRDDFDRVCLSSTGKLLVYDTMLMAKLDNQRIKNYSLDALGIHYKVMERKQSDMLHDYAWLSGLYQKHYGEVHLTKAGNAVNKRARPSEEVLDKYCKTHMSVFPYDIMSKYCLQDIRATKALFEVLMPKVEGCNLEEYSNIIKVCMEAKTRGMRISLKKARELSKVWAKQADDLSREIRADIKVDDSFNINSTKAMPEALVRLGINIPRTDKGNYSIKSEWLENQGNPVLKKLLNYRRSLKASKDFARKFIDYQQAIPEKYREKDYGWLYPTLKPFGAKLTGRFSSGGGTGSLEMNVLAISRRNEEFGAPIREIFIADEGERLVCCDFSNQEPRLQVHYANMLKCGGVRSIIELWNENPTLKYHQKVADLTGLPYDTAKMVTLGLSYNMKAKGLSEKLDISYDDAKALMYKYYRMMPFMKQLQDVTAKNLTKLGYIKTIGGRKLKIDPPVTTKTGDIWTQESKAMSKLIQGSAADQIIRAMVLAWKEGLKILLSVHDEILISTKEPERDLLRLKHCMESAYTLCVPVVAEGGIGDNWGEAK